MTCEAVEAVPGTTGGWEADRHTCESSSVCIRSRARRARWTASTRSVTFAEFVSAVVKTVTTPNRTTEPDRQRGQHLDQRLAALGPAAGEQAGDHVHTEVPAAFVPGTTIFCSVAVDAARSVAPTVAVCLCRPSSTQTCHVPNGTGTSFFIPVNDEPPSVPE